MFKRVTVIINKIKFFLLQEIVPHFHSYQVNRGIKSDYHTLLQQDINVNLGSGLNKEKALIDLRKYLELEQTRKTTVEDKAKSSLFIISISITIMFGSFGLSDNIVAQISSNIFIKISLFSGILFIVASSITSISALNVGKFYQLGLPDHLNKVDDIPILNDVEIFYEINALTQFVQLNGLLTRIRTNNIYSTFIGIRNGLILISLSSLLLFFSETRSSVDGNYNFLKNEEKGSIKDSRSKIDLNSNIEIIEDSNEYLESKYLQPKIDSLFKTGLNDSAK